MASRVVPSDVASSRGVSSRVASARVASVRVASGRGAAGPRARRVAVVVLLASLTAAGRPAIPGHGPDMARMADSLAPPPIRREFRGLWVASVTNIDWPSRPGLSVWEQQAELITLLNQAEALHFNAVLLQVRPECDALYASSLEPWSYWLTGRAGQAPDPYYDPLAFAVEEAHRRGLQLHAWFNPFRAHHPDNTSPLPAMHVARAHPEWVRHYAKWLWLDPGDAAARQWSIQVITDVVRRYDIDGVHLDDYFYPYPERDAGGRPIDFPDGRTWLRYRRGGGSLTRDDWRRANVDTFIHDLSVAVKAVKPRMLFGVSPFGIWRPGAAPGTDGFDAWAQLYADSRKWLAEGWVDYFTPQLYWSVDDPKHGYTTLLTWWAQQNAMHRHLWPGNYTGRVGARGRTAWPSGEVIDQIRLTRETPGAGGNIHFSAEVFRADRDSIDERLVAGPYADPALVPASPWLGDAAPAAPEASFAVDSVTHDRLVLLAPSTQQAEPPWLYAVRARTAGTWSVAILPAGEHAWIAAPAGVAALPDVVVVSAVSRTGIEGPATTLRLPSATPPADSARRDSSSRR